jgi:hypothetical protein
LKKNINCIQTQPSDVAVILKYKNGLSRKQELYNGSSFLSQSSRFLNIDNNILSAEIIDNKGKKRNLNLR